MKTITKPLNENLKNRKSLAPSKSDVQSEYKYISPEQIAVCSNYRKYFNPSSLEELAQDIKSNGVISPLTVRPEHNAYELVSGERRLKAAIIAGLKIVPVIIRQLTDAEVLEIQLSENIHRENPHPLHEAQAIEQLQQQGKTSDEISTRLAKSKAFIYQRLRLVNLSSDLQPVFLAGIINLKLSLQLAELSPDSQSEIYETYFHNWNDKDFEMDDDIHYSIQNLRLDLSRAPFNPKSKSLVPAAGACTGCSYNSATLASLFPEMDDKARCNNAQCFEQKCKAHARHSFIKAFEKEKPEAVICTPNGASLQDIITGYEPSREMPIFSYYEVNMGSAPEAPEQEDYMEDKNEQGQLTLDKTAFEQALSEYHQESEEWERQINKGELKKGLYFRSGTFLPVWYQLRKTNQTTIGKPKITAREVQQAIQAGGATKGLLQSEIERIEARETRAKELDREKVQEKVHELFSALISDELYLKPSKADTIAGIILAYHSMGYTGQQRVKENLFKDISFSSLKPVEQYNLFAELENGQIL